MHCLYGADADLIMLGLATHEVNFNILREEFVPNQPRACELCGEYGHELENCTGSFFFYDLIFINFRLAQSEKGPDQADPLKKNKNFIFIRLTILREHLKRELQMPNLPFEYDFERAVDDWVTNILILLMFCRYLCVFLWETISYLIYLHWKYASRLLIVLLNYIKTLYILPKGM